MKPDLSQVTLAIVDCVDYTRARLSFDHCKNSATFGDAKFLTHFEVDDPDVVKIPQISSITEYSEFIVKRLADYIDTPYVLVAQWDGFIWHPELWEDEFLKYDYIGAPWFPDMLKDGIPKHCTVGNGGFSLRSKRLQDFLRDDPNIIMHKAEDVAICQYNRPYLEKCGFTFAPEDVARRFSLENGDMVPRFGAHARIRLVR